MKGEITTRTMILETDTSTKETDKIVLDMLYQSDITYYTRRIKQFKKNLRKSYTIVWEF